MDVSEDPDEITVPTEKEGIEKPDSEEFIPFSQEVVEIKTRSKDKGKVDDKSKKSSKKDKKVRFRFDFMK